MTEHHTAPRIEPGDPDDPVAGALAEFIRRHHPDAEPVAEDIVWQTVTEDVDGIPAAVTSHRVRRASGSNPVTPTGNRAEVTEHTTTEEPGEKPEDHSE